MANDIFPDLGRINSGTAKTTFDMAPEVQDFNQGEPVINPFQSFPIKTEVSNLGTAPPPIGRPNYFQSQDQDNDFIGDEGKAFNDRLRKLVSLSEFDKFVSLMQMDSMEGKSQKGQMPNLSQIPQGGNQNKRGFF